MTKDSSLICRRRMGIQLACSFVPSFLRESIRSRSWPTRSQQRYVMYVCMYTKRGRRFDETGACDRIQASLVLRRTVAIALNNHTCNSRVHTYLALTVASSFAVVAMASSFLPSFASKQRKRKRKRKRRQLDRARRSRHPAGAKFCSPTNVFFG